MFESLSEKLEGALKDVSGQGRINELNIAETMREIRRALLDADVNYQVARDFTDRVKEQGDGRQGVDFRSAGPAARQDRLRRDRALPRRREGRCRTGQKPPTIILVAGLQGSGKTTFCGKLAKYFKSKGRAPDGRCGRVPSGRRRPAEEARQPGQRPGLLDRGGRTAGPGRRPRGPRGVRKPGARRATS
jgi:signal recognition particle GTPase